jgi:putative sugar O-methyltransferase
VLIARGKTNRLLGRSPDEADVRDYECMTRDNQSSSPLYIAGEFWARFNRQHAAAIWGGGLRNLRNEYFNRTFSGPEPESRQVYRALLFLYYKHVRQLDSDGFLDRFEDPAIGGTLDQEMFDGRALSLDFLQSVEEAYRIRHSWNLAGRTGSPRIIVELGAGYGRLAYVCRRMMPECTYVILDLPEALICAQSWLSRVLPDEVVTYRVGRDWQSIDRARLAGGKVFLFLPHKIESIVDDIADVFVNIYSFAEMPRTVIENYFRHLDRITSGVFYTKQRKLEINTYDQEQISSESYPVGERWMELFRGTTTLYDNFFEAAYATRAR